MLINSFKSIVRSKGRTLLIIFIVTMISVGATVSLSILKASKQAQKDGLELENTSATIELDRSQMMQGGTDAIRDKIGQIESIDVDTLLNYGDSEFVKGVYTSSTFTLNGLSIEAYSESELSSNSNQGMNGIFGNRPMGNFESGDFSISAISDNASLEDFSSGSKSLIEGSFINFDSNALEVVVNKELLDFNGLKLGDSIVLSNPKNEANQYTFIIVGVYSAETSTTTMPQFGSASDGANLIYMSELAANVLAVDSMTNSIEIEDFMGNIGSSAIQVSQQVTYLIENPAKFELFEAELRSKGLDEAYALNSPDINSYKARIAPYDNLVSFANTLFWVVLAIGCVVLVVIHSFNIRERKFEVGVLTAIGLQKWKVASQFVLEILMVTMMGILLGCAIGSVVSVQVSNKLLENQMTTTNPFESMRPGGMQPGNMAPPTMDFGAIFTNPNELFTSIDVTVDLEVLGNLIGVGVLISIISSAGAVLFILRYEPLQILAERA